MKPSFYKNSNWAPDHINSSILSGGSKLAVIEQLCQRILLDSTGDVQYQLCRVCDFRLTDWAMLGSASLNPTY
ncbi:MAG: hypothetical protein P8Y45_11850 [Exilibacterium sp.]